jgi:3-oxoacyl-[acyl-carrier-protein] synthase II
MNKMSPQQRVVITGTGIVSSIGCDVASVWESLLAGRSGLRKVSRFDASENRVQHGAEVDPAGIDGLQSGKLLRADLTVRFAVEAARQALEAAGLELSPERTRERQIASIWGSACGQAGTLFEARARFTDRGPRGLRPSTVPKVMSNATSAEVSMQFGLTGTNQVVVSACTSATNAIGQAFRMIRHGEIDAALCGGSDAFFDPFYFGVWNNLGVLSPIEDPAAAVRPFDANRQGTLLGEGAGALMLESLESAQRRGATIRGELLGYGESSDATHITNPSVDGQRLAIENALRSAAVDPTEIGYVNAHGTATLTNDVTESRSIRAALGDVATDGLVVGANKSYLGHTLGASGGLESVITVAALERRLAPPNLNLDDPDPECQVPLVGRSAQPLEKEVAMKNSFGFGGGNGVLIFRRFS